MRDIEPKVEEHMNAIVGEGPSKKKESIKIYPRLRMEHQFFPEAKKWEVSEEYTVTLKLKMTGLSISKFQNDSEFDIIGVDIKSKK